MEGYTKGQVDVYMRLLNYFPLWTGTFLFATAPQQRQDVRFQHHQRSFPSTMAIRHAVHSVSSGRMLNAFGPRSSMHAGVLEAAGIDRSHESLYELL